MTAPTSRRGPSSRPVTPHQLKALQLAATGHTHQQIASELGISEKSVGKLMTEIFRKIGAKSMPHAVLLACQAGILDGRPQRHGDHAGFTAHVRRGEDPWACPHGCPEGERTYRTERRRTRRTTDQQERAA
ncbi:response regulator transcription factor [Streptomyces sp. NPDC093223]|uniref:response regulator transcription factor n=1 Tax=Streptomyces sp. NPDC093223 TaxID=3366033 RepID=UPI003826F579